MLESEERLVPYLFKLRHTPKVKAPVQRMMEGGGERGNEGVPFERIGEGLLGSGREAGDVADGAGAGPLGGAQRFPDEDGLVDFP